MPEVKRVGSENALQKTVRLLGKMERELLAEGTGEQLNLIIRSDGTGHVSHVPGDHPFSTPVFCFPSLEQLSEFLEAGQLARIEMVRGELG
jgi:hypothetical protein